VIVTDTRNNGSAAIPGTSGFDKYRLVKRLSSSRCSETHLAAIDGVGGFTRACVVRHIWGLSNDSLARLVRQVRAAATLNHPHIQQVIDFGDVGDGCYVAMDFIRGASLRQILDEAQRKKRVAGPELAVSLGLSVCDALAFAESVTPEPGAPAGVVHPQLSPAVVFVSTANQVKIADFCNTPLPEDTMPKWVRSYQPPEQRSGTAPHRASNVYSVGAMLWELATGAVFEAGVDVRQAGPLGAVLARALAPAEADRYPAARAMHDDLEAIRQQHGWKDGFGGWDAFLKSLFVGWTTPSHRDAAPRDRAQLIPLIDDWMSDTDIVADPRTDLGHVNGDGATVPTRERARMKLLVGTVWVTAVLAVVIAGGLVIWLPRAAVDPSQSTLAPSAERQQLTGPEREARAHRARGLDAMDRGDFATAIDAFQAGASLDPASDNGELLRMAKDLPAVNGNKAPPVGADAANAARLGSPSVPVRGR
jgi:hypothetical protein